jgi:hypothetical protein
VRNRLSILSRHNIQKHLDLYGPSNTLVEKKLLESDEHLKERICPKKLGL